MILKRLFNCMGRRAYAGSCRLRLDVPKRVLARRGLEAAVHAQGVGAVIAESNWAVCDQWPDTGSRVSSVELYVEHFCDEEYDDDEF